MIFKYNRTFKSQINNDKATNNCWACSINAIKSRNNNDLKYYNKISNQNLNGFNNNIHGVSPKDFINTIRSNNISSLKVSDFPEFYKYIHEILTSNILDEELHKNPILVNKIKSNIYKYFHTALKNYGPLIMLRQAIGSIGTIHAISIIDIDEKKVRLFNSMEEEQEDVTWEDFILFEFIHFLDLITQMNYNPLLKELTQENFTLLFYDNDFVSEKNSSFLMSIKNHFKRNRLK